MKKILFYLASLFALLSVVTWYGCGGGAPPASIPAPVTQLMTISPPDPTGAVTISGQPGAALANANIEARNVNQVGPFTWLKELLIRSAFAQIFTAQTTADAQGAFTLLIDGASGDRIDIRQELNGDFSAPVTLTVP
ncbi:MAG: hypothetical protein U1F66_06650 [bacterium]